MKIITPRQFYSGWAQKGESCVKWDNGTFTYYRNGSVHRTDGPATTWNGREIWCVDDTIYKNNKAFQEAAGISNEDMTIMIMKYGNVK